MLLKLSLSHVGPAPRLELEPGPRLNLITGDNGLGKSFLLDIAWWALSGTWAGMPARPQLTDMDRARIDCYRIEADAPHHRQFVFDRRQQDWRPEGLNPQPTSLPATNSLVIYAQVDGSFALYDPARNLNSPLVLSHGEHNAYFFQAQQLWDGLKIGERYLCNGLLADWASWQKENGAAFAQLKRTLALLSPGADEPLEPGALTRIGIHDSRDIPTLRQRYGQEVPIVHVSAGMRRILSLAYLVVWAWHEHLRAAEQLGQAPAGEIVFLIDEVETHLHPRWQRRLFSALLDVIKDLMRDTPIRVQILATTHSPLMLSAVEPLFVPETDRLFILELNQRDPAHPEVALLTPPWSKRGEADRWLTSEAFGLASGRSLEAEQLTNEASRLLADTPVDPDRAQALNIQLGRHLGDHDPFWLRWRFLGEQQGWLK